MNRLLFIIFTIIFLLLLNSDYIPILGNITQKCYANPKISFELNGNSYKYRGNYLQKGLMMTYDGKSLVGGALGFGVPVIREKGQHYFSSKGAILDSDYSMAKNFLIDTKMYKDNNDEWKFAKCDKLVGSITVKYTILNNRIRILADLSAIGIDYDDVVMYNEQSGNSFPVYMGSSLSYINNQNFGWSTINNNCSEMFLDDVGYFLTDNKNIGFGVPCRNGAKLVRSRSDSGYYNHSGLHLVVTNGSKMFYYTIYYETPQNSTKNWWEAIEKSHPLSKSKGK